MPDANGRTIITNLNVTDPNGNPTLAAYRFVTFPATTSGTLWAYNQASGRAVIINSTNQQVNPFEFPNLAYDPIDGRGSVSFSFAGVDNSGSVSPTATYTINVANATGVNQAPVTRDQTSQALLNTAGATLLQTPLFGVDPDGTVASYVVTALPASGTLALNGTAVTLNQNILAADAAGLTFDPAANTFGTVTFRYRAVDNNTGTDATPAFYAIPVSNASCVSGNNLLFYPRAELEDWTVVRTATVQGVTISAGSYAALAGGTALRMEDNPTMPGKALVWTSDYPEGTAVANRSASVSFSFSRALTGFTMSLGDIDLSAGGWIDQVKLEGYTAAGTLVTLAAADVRVGNAATYSGNNIITGTVGSSTADANTVVTWPQAITRVVVTYANVVEATVTNPAQQVMTFETFSWCGQADVSTTIAAVATPVTAGTTGAFNVTYANAATGDAAVGVIASVQLPSGLSGVTFTNLTTGVTGSYDAGTGLVTFAGTPVSTLAPGASFSARINFTAPGSGPVSATSTISTTTAETSTVNNTATASIAVTPVILSGNVFEDVNYGGGAGRTLAAANTSATASGFANNAILRPGVVVELYNSSGTLVGTTTTNSSGAYSFNSPGAGNYTVRVVNSTVTSARGLNSGATGLVPVQTFVNGDVNRVGGEDPIKQDVAANTGSQSLADLINGAGNTAFTAQSLAPITLTASGATNINFGYNFDVVVNTNSSGQGSFAQFVANANGLANTNLAQTGQTAGAEVSIFMISDGRTTNVPAGTRSGVSGGAVNGVATIGLAGTTPLTITDANTTLSGLTQSSLYGNPSAPITESSTGPEVIIDFNGQAGLSTGAANTKVISLGFTDAAPTAGSGSAALSILNGASGALVQDNTFYSNGANMRINDIGLVTVTGNIFRNALANNSDGIELTNSSLNTITNNQFINNAGYGIDFISGANDGNTITGNLFKGNGQTTDNGQTAGIGIRSNSSNNVISGNTFTANVGDGISAKLGVNNVFSQNSFYDNGDLAIDLAPNINNNGDGVTLNESGDADGSGAAVSANGLLNFPVIQSAIIRNGNLIVSGYATSNAVVEFFLSDNFTATAGFGEGKTYLASRTEGSGSDADATTGTYGPGLVNGLAQGTETGQRRFSFSISLASLSAEQLAQLNTAGAKITATATLSALSNGNQGTSEFSGTAAVLQAPVANNDFATTTPGGTVTLNVTNNDQNNIDPASVSLNGQAPGSTTAVTVTGGTFTFTANGVVSFTANAGFTGVATVPYTVNNTSGAASNTAFISVEVRNASIDLATSITAPANNTAVNAGAALTYTVQASNTTSTAVNGVVQTLQLPAGLGTVTVSGGAYTNNTTLYNNTTGLVTIPVGTLAGNTSQNYSVAVSAMPGSGPVTATANISGTGTETSTTNNVASTTVTVTPRYDVATTISGPATGVVRGNEVTYTVTTSNLTTTGSASPAPNVIQTVQLPAGLTGVFASNGGTYNSGNGLVTFPAISSLPVGQSVVNTISFAAPAANFTGPTATVTAGASSNNAGDIATTNNSANLNGLATNPTVATVVAGAASVNVYTTISSSATNVAPGGSVTLTVTASNAGPGTAASVTETLQLPAGLTRGGTLAVTVSNGGTYNDATGLVTFTSFGNLAPNASASATVTFAAPAQGIVLATATVSTTSADLVAADNLAQTKVEINPVADVATTVAGPTTVVPGQTATYTVTTSSLGETPAVGVVQRVSLPAGLSGVTVSGGGSYNSSTGIVTFTFADALVKGSTQTNTISFTVPTGATNYSAVANVSTTTPETVVNNNTATVNTTVQPLVDLAVSVSGPATAVVGSAVTYSVSTTNNGPSTATAVAPTLQLPTGLSSVLVTGGGSYNSSTGVVTFSEVASLPSGSSFLRTATFLMTDASSVNGVARVSSGTSETKFDNNYASVATTAVAPGTTTTNLATTIAAPATVAAGAQVTVTANFSNVTGSGTATAVVPSLALPAGLNTYGTVTVAGGTGGTYNNATGLVTWNSPGNLNGGAGLTTDSYRVTFTAPASGSVTATSFVTSSTPETVLDNNIASTTISVTASADVATSVSGPATALPGATVTYAVLTLNNGVSPASSTQTVRIPAAATNIVVPAGSTQSAPSGGFITVTFPAIANQPVGLAGEVTNYVSFTAPSVAYSVNAVLLPGSATGDVTSNNSVTVNTSINRAPVAYNVVNNLQTPEANTAGPLLISPLVATDADGNTLTYTITSLPATTSGILYLGAGTGSPISVNQTLTAAQISTLRFDPVTNFIGNAFFTYTATDNATAPATSNTAIYTIAVGQDVNSVYVNAPNKGGTVAGYVNGDLIASVVDANSFRYNSSGAIYNPEVNNGTIIPGTDNGVRSATTDAAGSTLLASLGLTLDPVTGEIRVTNRTLLRGGSYTLNITTIDASGGTNTQPVTFLIGVRPLPVELTVFEAKAKGRDGLLTWETAQEKNNERFDVERSLDGKNFVKIGSVQGNGTSATKQQYSFTDVNAANAATQVYYRLTQVDFDGTSATSPVRSVLFGTAKASVELALYPSPAVNSLNVSLTATADKATVTVFSTTGALLMTQSLDSSLRTTLDVSNLPTGAYILKVQAANGVNLTRRFVKQ
ncbi:hypothetical protein GCM10023186_08020 [Hymenobacter koreensis]|uniref:T9SS type A sorting domain-containing protein n=1 Tax=Hymenobacter koreensis TaxID=1084523 RepID=A0ABP8IVX2_9BACT